MDKIISTYFASLFLDSSVSSYERWGMESFRCPHTDNDVP